MSTTKNNKGPFLIFEEFISPKICSEIIKTLDIRIPDTDPLGNPISSERTNDYYQHILFSAFQEKCIQPIEERFNVNYSGISEIIFQFYPEYSKAPARVHACENSKLLRKKWVKVKDVDLTGVLWLKNYNDSVPIDTEFEVYGGKLEFPIYNFSLVPQIGTFVIFPAGPHFINAISPVLVSDLYQVKINISISEKNGGIWLYQPEKFGTNWNEWFEEYI